MQTNTIKRSVLILSISVIAGSTMWAQKNADSGSKKMKVKIIRIVNGDTTIKEQVLNEAELKEMEKQIDEGGVPGKRMEVSVFASSDINEAFDKMDSLIKKEDMKEIKDDGKGGKHSKKVIKKTIRTQEKIITE